jgi:glyoxylase-like metal-dependent hydrolase (beta-lactamase superfamily II)
MRFRMKLPPLTTSVPPLPAPQAPVLARWFTPAGPAEMTVVEAGGARVVCVPGRYCVTTVIEGPELLVLVDVGSATDVPRIREVAGWLQKPVGLVIASHLHFDHVLGLDAAAKIFGAELGLGQVSWAYVEGKRGIRKPRNISFKAWFWMWLWQGMPFFAREDLPRALRFGLPWADNPFQTRLGPRLCDGDPVPGLAGWEVLETPGHADDSICLLHREAGLLVAGDTARNFQGGEWNPLVTDFAAFRNTMARLKALEVQAVFPAHGPVIAGDNMLQRLCWMPL